MQLGIIAKPTEESFQNAEQKELDFVELCINEGHDVEEFYRNKKQLAQWKDKYGVNVGSIGRWKSIRINPQGRVIEDELQKCFKLIDVASELECANFVSGCNYVEELSYYENCSAAIDFFSILIEYGKTKGVNISSYNCRKVNFVHNPEVWKTVHGHLKNLGIKFDPSHSRYFGGDYLQETLEWGKRFNHVHLKGSLIVNGKRVDDPPAGLDQTDWKTFISLLRVNGYTGGLSIEPHSPVWTGDLGEKGIDYTISYMKNLLF
ncbi:sugar phosphate isomerase/epimerase [Priestia aryabhattai]|uniref:sugar phosphate isomerase/epimerase family protein n=1 Tax=Priestia aryabhattai TaxID=412384 RepID=UPI002881F4CD|nr:sugar phosphate isomerase/epimerase [Priestia aryabhattai]MDT0145588.1 sugar phosphate isomerase/epimerase [Priestia aryabhattai]MDT0151256.1 sugar phosphate isomerase/epimerase [Priestia aryabhattai]